MQTELKTSPEDNLVELGGSAHEGLELVLRGLLRRGDDGSTRLMSGLDPCLSNGAELLKKTLLVLPSQK